MFKRLSSFLAVAVLLVLGTMAAAQTGPDVIVGDLTGPANYSSTATEDAFAIGTTSCNIGDTPLNWISSTNDHPVIAQNLYKYENGRLIQIGMSWLKHGFFALQGSLCSSCTPNPNGSALGVGCSDPYSASLNGNQGGLGPRSEVNASTGFFPYPPNLQPPVTSSVDRRVRVALSDLDTSSMYFAEGHYIAKDDAQAGNGDNNASWRPAMVSGGPSNYNLSLTGGTVREQAAIFAWQTIDTEVQYQQVDVPSDGRMNLAFKPVSLGNGFFRYEYALHNLNSDRSAGSIQVALPAGTTVQNPGFHDVHHHSGEPYSTADWTFTTASNGVSWSTTPHATDPNANALRWGTMFNFWFEADATPGDVTIGLFKPGTPSQVTVPAFTVPTPSWQVNQAAAHLDIDGQGNGAFTGPVAVTKATGESGNLNYSSSLTGNAYDIIFAFAPAQPALLTTGTGQIVNVPFTDPTAFSLNNGFGASVPAGQQTIPFSIASPVTLSGQMGVLDPSHADGLRLSAAVQLDVVTCSASTITHNLGDDNSVQVSFGVGNDHECVSSIPFAGTNWTSCFINSNGSVSFGSGTGDFSATPSEFRNQMPRLAGMWTDLSPNAGGSVQSTDTAPGLFTVSFTNVPEWGTSQTSSFDIQFDAAAGSCSILNYAPAAGHGTDTLVGLSPGSGAGANSVIWSSLSGAGQQSGSAGSAVYQFVNNGAPGGFSSIVFPFADSSAYIVN